MDIITHRREIEYSKVAKLYEEDLVEYGKGLLELIHLYRKHIFINDELDEKILNELEYYGNALANREYDKAIMHSEEIVTHESEDTLPF